MTGQSENALTSVGELAQTLLQFDYFYVQTVIDKRVIFNALKGAFQREGVFLEAFLQKKDDGHYFFWKEHAPPKVLPVYGLLWTAAAHFPYASPLVVRGNGGEEFVQEKGAPVFNFDKIIEYILSHTEAKISDNSVRPAVVSYMEDAAHLLKCFTYKFTSNEMDMRGGRRVIDRARHVIAPLMELLKSGYGIPYVVGGRDTVRVEVRIPVWDVEAVPEIIDCPDAPWLEIAIIQGRAFVPEKVWRYPEKLTAQDILEEPNMEVRRVMLERLGNEKFIEQANLTLLDERDGLKLYAVRLDWSMHFNLVQCVCPSTLRVYYLRVPPNITSANAAIAWTFGETRESYRPNRET